MLNELRVASDLLQVALNRYLNACLTVKDFHAKTPLKPAPQTSVGSMLINELLLIPGFESILYESRQAISRSVNLSPDIVPISKLPTDILIHTFQQLVDIGNFDGRKIPKYPLVLSHVCAHWRQVVFDSPSLWSYFKIGPTRKTEERLLAYASFQIGRIKQGLVDLAIESHISPNPKTLGLSESMVTFFGRIRSLALRVVMPLGHWNEVYQVHRYPISESLKASNGLKRLAINALLLGTPSEHVQWFMESSSNPHSHIGIKLDLPHEHLEAILHPISELYLEGMSFRWTSKAYHGLSALTLGRNNLNLTSIPEIQLLNILASSPQLRWLSVDLDISAIGPSPEPVYLPHLRDLIDIRGISLLRLIQPGPDELTVSISHRGTEPPGVVFDPIFSNFFARANVTKFYSSGLLHDLAEARYFLFIAPSIHVLALSNLQLPSHSVDANGPGFSRPLKKLILYESEVELSELRRMIQSHKIEKFVLGNIVTPDGPLISAAELVSDSDNTTVRFVSVGDMSLLLGQFRRPRY